MADAPDSSAVLRARLARLLEAPAARPLGPPPIPDHTLHRCIGEGACGEVWLARNALGTMRAVKVVYRARFKDDRPYERELDGILKYEPISRTHEGLVQVLHVGRNDEAACFYYVMELADAELENAPGDDDGGDGRPPGQGRAFPIADYRPRTLRSELARRERLPPTEAAQLTLGLAKALGHLHDRGLVHRDIKPSNVIFVAGQPKLADIGLVTDVGSSHSFVGTEGFIPPEGPGTPVADLYAVGKLLYELATGRDRMDFPQLPPGLRQWPDGEEMLELNEVVTRACAPHPADRYATATELQAELNLFLAGRSLRRTRTIERGLAQLKRVAVVACLLLVLTAAALWFSRREQRHAWELAQAAGERVRSETALRQRAEAAEQKAQQQLYTALLEQARASVRSGELGQRVRALDAIRRAAAISNRFELRPEALAALTLPDLRFDRELTFGQEYTLRWLDPTFDRIALSQGRGPVEIRAVSDGRLLATLPASTNLVTYGASWSRDGQYLMVKRDYDGGGGVGADLEVWEVNQRRLVLLIHGARSNARSFHPRLPQLLVGNADGSIAAWDLVQAKELARASFGAYPDILAYSPDGELVAALYSRDDGWGVSVHQAADGALVSSQVLADFPAALDWEPDGRRIAITDFGARVQLMDARTGKLQLLGRHKAEATTAQFSPQGEYLFTGGWERELICWDARTMQRVLTIGLDSYVVQFRADGQACALTLQTGVQVHTFERPALHREFPEDLGPRLRHAAFSPDGRWLAASANRRIGVWDLTEGTSAALAEAGVETQLFWTPDGQELFGSSRNERGYRWRIQSATNSLAPPILREVELRNPDDFVSLSLAGNRVVLTTARGSRVMGIAELTAAADRWADTAKGNSAISVDARWLGMYRAYGPILYLYQMPELAPVVTLTNQAAIAGFSFSPLRDEVAVASRGQVEFWSTTDWHRTRVATNFIGIPDVGMLFEPGGRTLWLAKDFRTAGLYELRSLEPILFLPGDLLPLALSADGRWLAASAKAQRLQVWDLAAARQLLGELGLGWEER